MPELTPRILNHFAFLKFKDAYYSKSALEKGQFQKDLLDGLRKSSQTFYLYQVYPAQAGADLLIWSALEADDPNATARFLNQFACATNPFRSLLEFKEVYWGSPIPAPARAPVIPPRTAPRSVWYCAISKFGAARKTTMASKPG